MITGDGVDDGVAMGNAIRASVQNNAKSFKARSRAARKRKAQARSLRHGKGLYMRGTGEVSGEASVSSLRHEREARVSSLRLELGHDGASVVMLVVHEDKETTTTTTIMKKEEKKKKKKKRRKEMKMKTFVDQPESPLAQPPLQPAQRCVVQLRLNAKGRAFFRSASTSSLASFSASSVVCVGLHP